MGGRDIGRRLLAGLASLTLLAGCGAGASPTPATFGPVTVVTGTSRCPGLDFAWTTDADGTKHVRDDYHADRCTVTTDDPRVSGVPLLHLEHGSLGEAGHQPRARPVGHPAPRERRWCLGGQGDGRCLLPVQSRGHHRALVSGDRRLRRAVLLRAVDGLRTLEDPGPDLPGRSSASLRRGGDGH